jgi:uncharacterized protein (DUF427 family)
MSSNSGPGYAKHPEHRVALVPERERVVVTVRGEVIADSRRAIRVEEGSYPPVEYIPREDVKMERLVRTEHHTYCPFKGEASYFGLAGGPTNAVWTYEKPYDEVRDIAGHVAFYPDKVDSIVVG